MFIGLITLVSWVFLLWKIVGFCQKLFYVCGDSHGFCFCSANMVCYIEFCLLSQPCTSWINSTWLWCIIKMPVCWSGSAIGECLWLSQALKPVCSLAHMCVSWTLRCVWDFVRLTGHLLSQRFLWGLLSPSCLPSCCRFRQ